MASLDPELASLHQLPQDLIQIFTVAHKTKNSTKGVRERLLVVWGPVTVLTSDQPGRTATPSRTNSFVSGYLTEKLIDSLAREQLCIYVEGHLSDLCHGNIDSELHF